MSTLTRYWVKTAQLMKDDSTSILYSDIWTAVVKATEVEERSMMPYELTREHLLELQRNMEIKENEALRAKLEATDNDVRVLWIRIEELRAEIERLQSC